MKVMKVFQGAGLLFLAIIFCFSVEGFCAELQPVQVELMSSLPSFTGAESICLIPVFKLKNPNSQMVSVTLDYTLMRGEQELGSSQMPLVYIPGGETVYQRDSLVVGYALWVAKESARLMSSASEVVKVILPLWKGMNGQEPAKLPEGLWSKVQAIKAPMTADVSETVQSVDGTERIVFFKGLKVEEE